MTVVEQGLGIEDGVVTAPEDRQWRADMSDLRSGVRELRRGQEAIRTEQRELHAEMAVIRSHVRRIIEMLTDLTTTVRAAQHTR
ncbi:hypothetical protein KIH74_04680 [Kineosporia sp. J2-2]|uniref:Uncharacterized protein n=1 Tax=Kineosporia corallincola TaxID=2835133 RepID=A0ABS5TAX3_9ACTN|nr:hypothetical protein [Kineosporia corallincola]MBT0768205.1 hypothetical protein [Kineosporia corallincola]